METKELYVFGSNLTTSANILKSYILVIFIKIFFYHTAKKKSGESTIVSKFMPESLNSLHGTIFHSTIVIQRFSPNFWVLYPTDSFEPCLNSKIEKLYVTWKIIVRHWIESLLTLLFLFSFFFFFYYFSIIHDKVFH